MKTYLKDLTQSIVRYGGLTKHDFGLRVFGCTSVSLLGAEFLASKDSGQAPHVKRSMTI